MTEADEPKARPKPRRSGPFTLGTNTLFQAGGYGLLAFSIYNIILAFVLGGKGPEVVLPRIGQLINQLPWLIVATLMIFATWNPNRANDTGPWREFTRWFVLMMAVAYMMMVPLSFINEFTLIQADKNRIIRVELDLKRRSKQIMAQVADVATIDEFKDVLARIPEITEVVINAGETPDQVRKAMRNGLEQTINKQVETLKVNQQERLITIGPTVRSAALGSLLGFLTMISLAIRLHPWMAPALPAMRDTVDKAVSKLGKRPRQVLQRIRLITREFQRKLHSLKVGKLKASSKRSPRRSAPRPRRRRRRIH
jgi:hypothetical protein